MATASEWRTRARRVIDRVLAGLPADADEKTKRAAVREAYPFGPREHHPYKCWLAEVKAALAKKSAPDPSSVEWRIGLRDADPAYFVHVRCGWCDRTVFFPESGCLMCGPRLDELTAMIERTDFGVLLRTVRDATGDPLPRLVLADWLDEHDHGELADLFRGTTEG
jgi:uncharacterized protein (TIGR02996 family)